MKSSARKGFSFGLTSGIITTLGLIVGLDYSTHSRLAVIGGILVIAIADAFSDSLGMHISQESEYKNTDKQIWTASFATFVSKFIFAITFVIPFLLFDLGIAVNISILWGLLMIGLFSYHLAKKEKIDPFNVIVSHLIITVIVIAVTYVVGNLVAIYMQ